MVERSQSSDTSSRIEVWLDDQPSPPRQHEPHQAQIPSRKRRRPVSGQLFDRQPRKRKYLMELSGNAGENEGFTSERKLRSSHTHTQPNTTRFQKRAKRSHIPPGQEWVSDGSDSPQKGDPDPTPRPRARQTCRIPPIPSFDPANHEESSESNRSLGSKPRSQSPTKNLGDFQFAEVPVDPRAWSAAIIPQELKSLVTDMENIRDKIGIIPFAVRGKFVQVEECVHDFQCVEDWGYEDGRGNSMKDGVQKAKEKREKASDRMTGGLGHDQFWYEVKKIHRANTECLVGTKPESAWNTEVHARLLRLALDGHWAAKEVWYEDITQARIANKSLVPWNVSFGAMQSKMVDYAIVINPSREFFGQAATSLHNHIIEKLRREGGNAGINQTVAEWVRFKPIGVNIETKKGAVSEVEGHVQLGTWLMSQYSRLRQLCDAGKDTKGRYLNNVPLPGFPVLFVQGQRWLMMIACMRDSGRIDLIGELSLGETGSVIGVYQLIAAIRRLAQWVNDDYRPWFEREVLGI